GAQIWSAFGDPDVHGTTTLPEFDCATDAVRCLSTRSCSDSRNPVSVYVPDRAVIARRSLSRCERSSRRTGATRTGDSRDNLSRNEAHFISGHWSQQIDRENRQRNE